MDPENGIGLKKVGEGGRPPTFLRTKLRNSRALQLSIDLFATILLNRATTTTKYHTYRKTVGFISIILIYLSGGARIPPLYIDNGLKTYGFPILGGRSANARAPWSIASDCGMASKSSRPRDGCHDMRIEHKSSIITKRQKRFAWFFRFLLDRAFLVLVAVAFFFFFRLSDSFPLTS